MIETVRQVEHRTGKSAVETVHATIHEQIMAGELAAGTRLHLGRLRSEFAVSNSTVREALSRLLNDSLVTAETQRGFRVASMSIKDFRDITEARVLVETTAVRASLDNRDEAWECNLVAAFHRLKLVEDRLIGQGEAAMTGQWNASNAAFHDALAANCRNEWLIRFRHTLHRLSHRYHRLALKHDPERRDVRIEHLGIFEAAVAGDVELCVRRVEEHVNRTVETIIPALLLD